MLDIEPLTHVQRWSHEITPFQSRSPDVSRSHRGSRSFVSILYGVGSLVKQTIPRVPMPDFGQTQAEMSPPNGELDTVLCLVELRTEKRRLHRSRSVDGASRCGRQGDGRTRIKVRNRDETTGYGSAVYAGLAGRFANSLQTFRSPSMGG